MTRMHFMQISWNQLEWRSAARASSSISSYHKYYLFYYIQIIYILSSYGFIHNTTVDRSITPICLVQVQVYILFETNESAFFMGQIIIYYFVVYVYTVSVILQIFFVIIFISIVNTDNTNTYFSIRNLKFYFNKKIKGS